MRVARPEFLAAAVARVFGVMLLGWDTRLLGVAPSPLGPRFRLKSWGRVDTRWTRRSGSVVPGMAFRREVRRSLDQWVQAGLFLRDVRRSSGQCVNGPAGPRRSHGQAVTEEENRKPQQGQLAVTDEGNRRTSWGKCWSEVNLMEVRVKLPMQTDLARTLSFPEHWRGEASLAWLPLGRIVGIQTKVLIGVGACQ